MSPENDDDDVDIYEDLPDFNLEETTQKLEAENKVLSQKVKDLSARVAELEAQNTELNRMNKNLKANISALVKTVQAEIQRKDSTISELRQERENLFFRRQKPNTRGGRVQPSERNQNVAQQVEGHEKSDRSKDKEEALNTRRSTRQSAFSTDALLSKPKRNPALPKGKTKDSENPSGSNPKSSSVPEREVQTEIRTVTQVPPQNISDDPSRKTSRSSRSRKPEPENSKPAKTSGVYRLTPQPLKDLDDFQMKRSRRIAPTVCDKSTNLGVSDNTREEANQTEPPSASNVFPAKLKKMLNEGTVEEPLEETPSGETQTKPTIPQDPQAKEETAVQPNSASPKKRIRKTPTTRLYVKTRSSPRLLAKHQNSTHESSNDDRTDVSLLEVLQLEEKSQTEFANSPMPNILSPLHDNDKSLSPLPGLPSESTLVSPPSLSSNTLISGINSLLTGLLKVNQNLTESNDPAQTSPPTERNSSFSVPRDPRRLPVSSQSGGKAPKKVLSLEVISYKEDTSREKELPSKESVPCQEDVSRKEEVLSTTDTLNTKRLVTDTVLNKIIRKEEVVQNEESEAKKETVRREELSRREEKKRDEQEGTFRKEEKRRDEDPKEGISRKEEKRCDDMSRQEGALRREENKRRGEDISSRKEGISRSDGKKFDEETSCKEGVLRKEEAKRDMLRKEGVTHKEDTLRKEEVFRKEDSTRKGETACTEEVKRKEEVPRKEGTKRKERTVPSTEEIKRKDGTLRKEEVSRKEESKRKEETACTEEVKRKEEVPRKEDTKCKEKTLPVSTEEIKRKDDTLRKEEVSRKEESKRKGETACTEEIKRKEDALCEEEVSRKEDSKRKAEAACTEEAKRKEETLRKEKASRKEDFKRKVETACLEEVKRKEEILRKEDSKRKADTACPEDTKRKEETSRKEEVSRKEEGTRSSSSKTVPPVPEMREEPQKQSNPIPDSINKNDGLPLKSNAPKIGSQSSETSSQKIDPTRQQADSSALQCDFKVRRRTRVQIRMIINTPPVVPNNKSVGEIVNKMTLQSPSGAPTVNNIVNKVQQTNTDKEIPAQKTVSQGVSNVIGKSVRDMPQPNGVLNKGRDKFPRDCHVNEGARRETIKHVNFPHRRITSDVRRRSRSRSRSPPRSNMREYLPPRPNYSHDRHSKVFRSPPRYRPSRRDELRMHGPNFSRRSRSLSPRLHLHLQNQKRQVRPQPAKLPPDKKERDLVLFGKSPDRNSPTHSNPPRRPVIVNVRRRNNIRLEDSKDSQIPSPPPKPASMSSTSRLVTTPVDFRERFSEAFSNTGGNSDSGSAAFSSETESPRSKNSDDSHRPKTKRKNDQCDTSKPKSKKQRTDR